MGLSSFPEVPLKGPKDKNAARSASASRQTDFAFSWTVAATR